VRNDLADDAKPNVKTPIHRCASNVNKNHFLYIADFRLLISRKIDRRDRALLKKKCKKISGMPKHDEERRKQDLNQV
jgi:hypothetical protein